MVVRARFQGCLPPGRAPSSRLRAPLGEPGALGGSQLNPALKEGRGWDRHSLPTWPGGGSLASMVPVTEGQAPSRLPSALHPGDSGSGEKAWAGRG